MNIKKNRSKFFYAMLILAGSLLALLIVVSLVLLDFLKQYQKALPIEIVNSYVSELKSGNIDNAMNIANIDKVGFMDETQYKALLTSKIGESFDNVLVLETNNSTKENPEYVVKTDKTDGLTFKFELQSKRLRYNLKSYKMIENEIKTEEYKVVCGEGTPITVNNKVLDDSFKESETVIEGFSGVKNNDNIPKLITYSLKNLYVKPEVTSENKNITYDETKKTFFVGEEISDTEKTEYEKIAVETAKTYAKFVSGDVSKSALNKYIYANTDFDSSVSTYSSYWYIKHQGVEFGDLKVTNATKYNDNSFCIEVRFNYLVKVRGTTNTYKTAYKMTFLKQNKTYLATAITPIAE